MVPTGLFGSTYNCMTLAMYSGDGIGTPLGLMISAVFWAAASATARCVGVAGTEAAALSGSRRDSASMARSSDASAGATGLLPPGVSDPASTDVTVAVDDS